jgi:hypothetical protein
MEVIMRIAGCIKVTDTQIFPLSSFSLFFILSLSSGTGGEKEKGTSEKRAARYGVREFIPALDGPIHWPARDVQRQTGRRNKFRRQKRE